MESLTERLRTKLELTYDGIWDTPHSFQYLTRFKIKTFAFCKQSILSGLRS